MALLFVLNPNYKNYVYKRMDNLETKKINPKTRKVEITVGDDDKIFYVYRHWRLDPITGEEVCFYVGRGKHDPKYKAYRSKRGRAYSRHGRNSTWTEIASASKWRVEIVDDFLTFVEVCKLEDELVEFHGRIDLSTGTICNLCKGGTGTKDRVTTRKTLQGHIDDNVAFIPLTGCWIWLGTITEGRPKIHLDNKSVTAYRPIYEYFKNVKITPRKQSLKHTCGVKHCVNPDHMIVIKGNNPKGLRKKITEDDIQDVQRLLPYFYPSQIADLFPNIAHNTLRQLSTALDVSKVEIKDFDWKDEVGNHSTKHLSLEDVVDIKRLSAAGISAHKIAHMYNLNRVKVIGIAKGYKGKMFFENLMKEAA